MKSFLVLAAILLSSEAMSSEVLLKLSRGSGFSPIPTRTVVTISENGQIVVAKTVRNTTTKEVLGKLSVKAVESLKDKIEEIADDAVLVDLDAKKPRCMDAPSTEIAVTKGSKEIVIAAKRSCHRFEVEAYEASNLSKLIESVATLSSK